MHIVGPSFCFCFFSFLGLGSLIRLTRIDLLVGFVNAVIMNY